MAEKVQHTHTSHEAESSAPQAESQLAVNEFALEPQARTLLSLQNTIGNQAVQRAMASTRSVPAENDLAQRIRVASSGGHTLDAATRERLQASLGVDLSGVRVHLDDEADRLADSVEAVAFTTGKDIFFRSGMYQPETASGFHLLAHEVTHTIQQASGPVEGSLEAGVSISEPNDQHEQAAEQTAEAITLGQAVSIGPAPTPTVQRWGEDFFPFFNPTPQMPAQSDEGFMPFHNPTPTMPPPGTTYGTEPAGPGEAAGPYYYSKVNKQGGQEGGFGAFHGEGDIGGVPVTDDLLGFNEKVGAWDENGSTRYGFNANANVAKMTFNQGGDISGDVGAGTASADASFNPDTGLSAGAQANIVEGSVTLGAPSDKSDTDESVRFGLSAGVGAAGRLHWGDSDKDKKSEYGFGFDAGPVSFDVKTEDPLRTAAKGAAYGMLAPFGPAALAAPWLLEKVLPDGNLTSAAGEYAGAAWDATSQFAGDTWDAAGSAYDTAADYAGSAYDTVSDYAGSAYDTASDYAGAAWDTAGDVAGGAYDTASDAASGAWDYLTDW
ncbi:MAG: DUF4157 domain-containing protein [Thermoflexales bacterium]|nr:DUF4157 domain-containing protein [Thermoflexales bacterium]